MKRMNKREKELIQNQLKNEAEVIKKLKITYSDALNQINQTIEKLMARADAETASVAYQVEFQKAIQAQIGGILDIMNTQNFETIIDYLNTCYEDGYIGTFYDIQGQGIPIVVPIDQTQVVNAVQLESKISKGMYNRFGEDVKKLKKTITAEVSRGVSTAMSYEKIAKLISMKMIGTGYSPGGAYAHSLTISRTEGHRVQEKAGLDALRRAKEKGADVIKQWDSTLDGNTRESHRQVDGEIREVEEKFSNGLMYPGDPSGPAAEVCNCRCTMLKQARRNIGTGFSKMNNETGEIIDFSDIEEYNDFKKEFWKQSAVIESKKTPLKVNIQLFARKSSDFPTVILSNREYAHVMSELKTWATKEQLENHVFKKYIGDYIYTVENNGNLDFRIIGKEAIE